MSAPEPNKVQAAELPYSPDATFDFSCPSCQNKFQQTLAWLESPHEFACPSCGKMICCKDERIIQFMRDVHSTK